VKSDQVPALPRRSGKYAMLKVVRDDAEPTGDVSGSSLLDEIVREGARRMLAAALHVSAVAVRQNK
jgi:hypothetical protein